MPQLLLMGVGPDGVMVSAQQANARADLVTSAGPAVDALWDALCEQRGMPGPPVSGRAAPARPAGVRACCACGRARRADS